MTEEELLDKLAKSLAHKVSCAAQQGILYQDSARGLVETSNDLIKFHVNNPPKWAPVCKHDVVFGPGSRPEIFAEFPGISDFTVEEQAKYIRELSDTIQKQREREDD